MPKMGFVFAQIGKWADNDMIHRANDCVCLSIIIWSMTSKIVGFLR